MIIVREIRMISTLALVLACQAGLSAPKVAIGDPVQEAIAQCFESAYAAKSTLSPYQSTDCGVTCGQGNGLSADHKSAQCNYTPPKDHKAETFSFVSTSRTDRGWYTPPSLVNGGTAVRAWVGCNGHKSLGSAREWSKGYIRGQIRYLPTDAEQREIMDSCINQIIGDTP